MTSDLPPSDSGTEELPPAFRKGSSTEGILPLAGYYLGDQAGTRLIGEGWGPRLAILCMTLAACWAIVQRKRRGEAIGKWIPAIAIYLFVRGIAGLIWGEDVFFGIGIALKVGLGLVALGSVIIGKPLAARLAPLVLPFSDDVQAHPIYHRTMGNLTLGYAVYQLVTVGFEIWLLGETESGGVFLAIRTVIGWIAGFVGFFVAVLYVDRKLKKIDGFGGVMDMFEEIGMKLEEQRAANK